MGMLEVSRARFMQRIVLKESLWSFLPSTQFFWLRP